MPHPHYERLSALDAVFLSVEDRNAHMHVGSVSTIEAGPFRTSSGAIDFDRMEQAMMKILPMHARLRQKVWWPTGASPVWVDDPHLDLSYHFRRVALPTPGSTSELRTLVSRILSSPLDLSRPLWECWMIEGLEGDRICVTWKLHHCLADGVSVRDILIGYMGLERASEVQVPEPFVARPAPSVGQLRFDAALRRLEKTRELSSSLRGLLEAQSLKAALAEAAGGLVEVGLNLVSTVSPTPLNGEIGCHRRFSWAACPFASLREVRKEAGAKINDVVLAALSGALRRFFLGRGLPVDDLHFRVMIPVSLRSDAAGQAPGGNLVSNMVVPLPLFEPDPKRRLAAVVAATTSAKASGQSHMGDVLLSTIDDVGFQIPSALARFAARQLPANLVVTNIPGPQAPMYLLESELLESFPVVPLALGQGLGVALYSYNGAMYWGFNADRELLPDLDALVNAVEIEIDQVVRAHRPVVVRSRPKLAALARPGANAEVSGRRGRVRRVR